MRSVTMFLSVSLVVHLSALSAQQTPPVEVGARVRVSHSCITLNASPNCREDTGTLASITTDSVVLSEDGVAPLSFSLASVRRLEVVRGRSGHPWRGAGIGFLVGFTPMFVASHVYEWGGCMDDACFSDTGIGVLTGTVIGAGGALVGAIVGAFIKTYRWEEVPVDRLRVSFAPKRDGFALAFSIAF